MKNYNSAYPDGYVAQDAENQFESLFFRGGRYQREATVIPQIKAVSGIEEKELMKGYHFTIWLSGDLKRDYGYLDAESARKDRNDLLFQIERFWKNRK